MRCRLALQRHAGQTTVLQALSSYEINATNAHRFALALYLTQNDVLRADDEQVAVEALADLLFDEVMHVGGLVGEQLVDQDLLGKLDGQSAAVDGDLLHQLTAFDPHCEGKSRAFG